MLFRGLLLALVAICALAVPGAALAATPASVTTTANATEPAGNVEFTINCGTMGDGLLEAAATGVISYATEDGTASKGGDYEETAGTVACLPGAKDAATTKKVAVKVLDDSTDELTENLKLKISAGPGYLGTIPATNTATATIGDDDVPSVSAATLAYAAEGADKATVTVTLSQAPAQTVTVPFSTADSSATAGSDYTSRSSALTIAPGESTGTIDVALLDDGAVEPAEAFFVNLGAPTNARLIDDRARGTVVIFDNDTAPVPQFALGDTVRVTEGNSGTVNALFTVTLSQASAERRQVAWKTVNWTATLGDYQGGQGILVFEPGQTSKTISVVVKGDTTVEPNEVFGVLLEGPVGGVVNDKRKAALGIIVNDDLGPGPKVTLGAPFMLGRAFTTLVTCPTGASGCKGVLTATAGRVKVGTATFDLAGGKFADVKVKLSRTAVKALLRRALRVKLTAVVSDKAGATRTVTKRFRIKKLLRR